VNYTLTLFAAFLKIDEIPIADIIQTAGARISIKRIITQEK